MKGMNKGQRGSCQTGTENKKRFNRCKRMVLGKREGGKGERREGKGRQQMQRHGTREGRGKGREEGRQEQREEGIEGGREKEGTRGRME